MRRQVTGASGDGYHVGGLKWKGSYIEYTLNVPQPGTYSVSVRHRMGPARGNWQLGVDDVSSSAAQTSSSWPLHKVGSEVVGYATDWQFAVAKPGTVTFGSAGLKIFRFTSTGRHPQATSPNTGIDYIELTPMN